MLYDDPLYTALADKEVIENFNKELQKNPDFELPEVNQILLNNKAFY